MSDLKNEMQDNFLKYASYVILDRAIPNVYDGLKPVQRRILHTLYNMDDGKLHKVANVAGQTMAFHPHGDAPITEALVNLANKNFLLDKQGNFGNIYTGDPSAAARYIETRLSPLAKEILFNPEITQTLPSYDGRNQEPMQLPAKLPILLLQGAEGIAVGMSTKILPHNFTEIIEAQIAYLEMQPFTLYPDFPTGGIMDASTYEKGLGKIKLRAKLSAVDTKTIIISEICYGTTTESLIHSIDEAAKKGKIKIDSISDYTSDKVEIEIKLPRGQFAEGAIEALYGFTECEVSLSSQVVVIKDGKPFQTDIHEIIALNTQKLVELLQLELNIEKNKLSEKIFYKTLERIFIINRLYKKIEEIDSYEKIHSTIADSLKDYSEELQRQPTYEDREKLLNIPLRRISRFDINKNEDEIAHHKKELISIEKDLKNLTRFTINYLKNLLTKYGKQFPRKTQLQSIDDVNIKAMLVKKIKVYLDVSTGFVGTKVQSGLSFECTNFDKLLFFFEDGTYMVTAIEEKRYLYQNSSKLIFAGPADKKTIFTVLYYENNLNHAYLKRFVIDKFIQDKIYRFINEDDKFKFLTTEPVANCHIEFTQKARQKVHHKTFNSLDVAVKSVTAKGVRIASQDIKALSLDCPTNLSCICLNP